MTPPKATTTVSAFDRQDAALFLRLKLGPGFCWQKLLEMWAKTDSSEGLRGCSDVRCEPSFVFRRFPRYALTDLERFVLEVLEIAPELRPAPFVKLDYEFDTRFPHQLPWRMRRAKRCISTTRH